MKFYKNKRIYCLLCILIMFFAVGFLAGSSALAETKQTGKGKVDYMTVSFPQGTMIKSILMHNVSTTTDSIDAKVQLIIPADIKFGDITCIPKNSKLIGRILRLGKAEMGKNGFVEIIIETLQLPDNQKIDMLAHIWTRNGTGVIGGEFSQRQTFKKMPHAIEGIGYVAQLVPDGERIMGKETEVLAGSEWIAVLDKELKLYINEDF